MDTESVESLAVPAKFSAADTATPVADGWLADFDDPVLRALVREALVGVRREKLLRDGARALRARDVQRRAPQRVRGVSRVVSASVGSRHAMALCADGEVFEWGGGEIWFDGELIRKDGLFLPKDLRPLNPKNLKKA